MFLDYLFRHFRSLQAISSSGFSLLTQLWFDWISFVSSHFYDFDQLIFSFRTCYVAGAAHFCQSQIYHKCFSASVTFLVLLLSLRTNFCHDISEIMSRHCSSDALWSVSSILVKNLSLLSQRQNLPNWHYYIHLLSPHGRRPYCQFLDM